MRVHWQLASVLLITVALAPRAGAVEEPGTAAEDSLPPVSAGIVPAPAAALALLPPGIRLPQPDRDAETEDVPRPSLRVERIHVPPAGEGESISLEVEYTIDPALDERMRGVLAASRVALGQVILMDPATGEVFSYVTSDAAVFPATRRYPTASLMKVVTAAAMLHDAPEAASRECRYVGSPYHLRRSYLEPPKSGGRVEPFSRALAISNNQCFARLAVHDVGESRLLEQIERVGLLESPAALHPGGEVVPIGDALDLGHLGSGLAGSFVTPLGAARLAAALSAGELVQPYWIARVRDDEGNLLGVPRVPPRQIWRPEVTDELRELLVEVTARGTARSAFRNRRGRPLLGSIRVAGKTGSLSGTNPDGLYQWFIGVAPAESPSVAIATVVGDAQRPGSAAAVAAAALREIFCEADVCAAVAFEPVLARARERDAADRVQIEAAVAAAEAEAERQRQLELARVYEVRDLDQAPKLVGEANFDFPNRLSARRVRGKIVLSVNLSREGDVVDAEVASSDLRRFDKFVLGEVLKWKFTPPLRDGNPVKARADVPLEIQIR